MMDLETELGIHERDAEIERLRLKLEQAEKIAKLLPESAAEIERLRAAAELARKRLLDVVRNGDAEPEDVEAYEVLDRALKDKP